VEVLIQLLYIKLYHNTTGSQSKALGINALLGPTTDTSYIVLGYQAGSTITCGINNTGSNCA
jgi:hypothetical protein